MPENYSLKASEAFFICRRLAAEGDLEARTLAEQIREVMNGGEEDLGLSFGLCQRSHWISHVG